MKYGWRLVFWTLRNPSTYTELLISNTILLFIFVVSDQQALMEIMTQFIYMHTTQIVLAFSDIVIVGTPIFQLLINFKTLAACREAHHLIVILKFVMITITLAWCYHWVYYDINNVEFGKIMVAWFCVTIASSRK